MKEETLKQIYIALLTEFPPLYDNKQNSPFAALGMLQIWVQEAHFWAVKNLEEAKEAAANEAAANEGEKEGEKGGESSKGKKRKSPGGEGDGVQAKRAKNEKKLPPFSHCYFLISRRADPGISITVALIDLIRPGGVTGSITGKQKDLEVNDLQYEKLIRRLKDSDQFENFEGFEAGKGEKLTFTTAERRMEKWGITGEVERQVWNDALLREAAIEMRTEVDGGFELGLSVVQKSDEVRVGGYSMTWGPDGKKLG